MYCSFALGLRVGEMAALKIGDVLDKQGRLKQEINLLPHITKGKKQRYAYLINPKARQAFQAYLDERRLLEGSAFKHGAALFRSQWGTHFSPNALQQLFSQIFKDMGFEGASSHSGRRTFASRLVAQGIDLKALSVLMGHSSISTTAEYIADDPVRLKKFCSGLW